MALDEFVSKGWADHADDAEGVMARFPAGLALVKEPRHLAALAGLVTHVSAEHLGRYVDGLALLTAMEKLPAFDAKTAEGKAVLRSKAVLHLCAGDVGESARSEAAAGTGSEFPAASNRIRVLAVAASALAGQQRVADATRLFSEALALARYGPTKDDPAARSLASTGNNLAITFETRPSLTDAEKGLMLEAARAGRRYWEIAGTWKEVEGAEYRLAMSHLKAGDAKGALEHAAKCLAVIEANGSDAGEAFFAREALSKARRAAGDASGAARERAAAAALLPSVTDPETKATCEDALLRL